MSSELPNPQSESDLALIVNQDPPDRPLSRGRKAWIWVLAACLVAGGAMLRSRWGAGSKAADPPAQRPVSIQAIPAKPGEMDISLTGLGTVTPLNSVTVRSRVDGQLVRFVVQEGQVVQQGQLLAEIDPRPFQVQLMQAEGQKAKDQAAYANSTQVLERYKSLLSQGILSRQDYDNQSSTVNQYDAALKADQAQVESAKLNLVYSRITAPISGKVGLRLVDPGNIVHASDQGGICVIAPVQPINVLFTVPADSIQRVLKRSGDGKSLPVEAFDRDMKTKLATGSVSAIDNQVDPATGTVKIKALFANQDSSLFPNQFVNARLLLDTLKGAIIIPSAAIQRSPQGPYVYRVRKDDTVEMVMVEIQASDGEKSAIAKGLESGDMVVIEGLERLKPGTLVALARQEGQKKGKP